MCGTASIGCLHVCCMVVVGKHSTVCIHMLIMLMMPRSRSVLCGS